MKPNLNRVAAALVAAGLASPAFAETNIEEEIIVSGTRSPQQLSESLLSVSVLNQAEIEAAQAVDLPGLLSRLPGLDVDHNGGRGATASVRTRGTENDHVLVLVDGVRVASASSGQAAIQHIPLHHIERIEVVRGPRSSLYGADAIGGVIQVFTKKGSAAERRAERSLRFEYGSHDTRISELGIAGNTGQTHYSVNIGHEESDGINRTIGRSGADADRDGYRETAFSSSIGHTFANDVALEGHYLRSEGTTEFDSGAADETDFLNDNANLRLTLPLIEGLTVKADVGYARDERETFGSFPSVFDTERESASLQFDYALGEKQSLTAGYDFYDDKVESTANFTEGSRNNRALFAQYLADYGVASVQASLRNDDNEAFGNETTGSAAVGFDVAENTVLSFSYGTAFKAPTFNDLYFPFTDFGFGFTFVGNPDLMPESSESWEVMLKQFNTHLDWSLALYRTDIEDLIQSNFTSVENVAEAEVVGAEAAVGLELSQWRLDMSLEYIDAVDAQTDERLDNRSRTKAAVDVSRSFGRFNVAVSWLYRGNRVDGSDRLGGYALTEVRGNYRVSRALTLGFNVKNLFDKDYTLISGFRTFRTEGQTASVFARYIF